MDVPHGTICPGCSRQAVEPKSCLALRSRRSHHRLHQPVTRAEIEEIRGVSTPRATLDVLLETGWVRPRGRRKARAGRDLRDGRDFLGHFGLEALATSGPRRLKGSGLFDGTSGRLWRAGAFRDPHCARRRPAGTRRPRPWPGAARGGRRSRWGVEVAHPLSPQAGEVSSRAHGSGRKSIRSLFLARREPRFC